MNRCTSHCSDRDAVETWSQLEDPWAHGRVGEARHGIAAAACLVSLNRRGAANCRFGTHPNPLGSAGAHPFARVPALAKLNSFHGPPTAIGPSAGLLSIPALAQENGIRGPQASPKR